MVTVDVTFNHNGRVYLEGELIVVNLKVQAEVPSIGAHVTARFLGIGGSKKKGEVAKEEYTVSEIYLDETIDISKEKEFMAPLSGGDLSGQIKCQLPKKLPTSLEGSNGFIRYSLNLEIKTNEDVKKVIKYFTVVERNSIPDGNLPSIIWQPESQCVLSYFVCGGSSIRVNLFLLKQFYVPNDVIFVDGEISNFHRYAVEWVKLSFIQVLKYKKAQELKEKRVVDEIIRGSIFPTQTQQWTSECFRIPAIPPTSSSKDRFMTVKYKLLLQYKPCWKRKPTELEHKIVIGTSPQTDHTGLCKFGPLIRQDSVCDIPSYPLTS